MPRGARSGPLSHSGLPYLALPCRIPRDLRVGMTCWRRRRTHGNSCCRCGRQQNPASLWGLESVGGRREGAAWARLGRQSSRLAHGVQGGQRPTAIVRRGVPQGISDHMQPHSLAAPVLAWRPGVQWPWPWGPGPGLSTVFHERRKRSAPLVHAPSPTPHPPSWAGPGPRRSAPC